MKSNTLVGKNQKNLTAIGEVAHKYGIKTYVVRYWEKHIDEIKPLRVNKRRFYTAEQVVLIGQIKNLIIDKNYTLKGACDQLTIAKKSLSQSGDTEHYITSWLKQLKINIDDTIAGITV